ncbi:MAG: protease modulator HflC [Pseudomonadota bacterium]|nr:MAG: protease modulator HflC [Pseudomonadota bacterium]
MTRILVLVVVALATLWSSVFVIDETELGIVTQFGEYKRSVTSPGLYFKVPFLQKVHRMESRILGSDAPPAEYLTLDKKRLLADPVTRYRVTDPLRFYTTVFDEIGAKARLDDIVNSELRREIASHNFGEIVGHAREPLMQNVAERVRAKTKSFGIHVVDVRIRRADLPREVQESVFQRMRAERDRVAKQYRSEGEEEAAKIRAETDKERTILLATAYETAQKVRGEGDAESIRIYAEAFGKDPKFYALVRSLEAYERALGEDSTLVLSSKSDLFKYLLDPDPAR